jgi:hypothetical protein
VSCLRREDIVSRLREKDELFAQRP